MSRKVAAEKAAALWGPTARVFRHSGSQMDRNSRCSIQFIEPGGMGQPKLHIFGFGPTFEDAFLMAYNDQMAIYFGKWWEDTKKEFEQFSGDPKAYFREIMRAKFNWDPESVDKTEEKCSTCGSVDNKYCSNSFHIKDK